MDTVFRKGTADKYTPLLRLFVWSIAYACDALCQHLLTREKEHIEIRSTLCKSLYFVFGREKFKAEVDKDDRT